MTEISRRDFLKKSGAALAGMMVAPTIVPAAVLGKSHGHKSPSDKLNILGVGIGGRGSADLREMEGENIIGLADVDWKYAKHVFDRYPKAKRYNDYRKMFDEMLKQADAVMCATADHTHCIVACDAMSAGKHVYVEKPMSLYPYESRVMTAYAKKYKVATQQGNQGSSGLGTRDAIEWLQNGEIGEVRKVVAYTNRPIWPQGITAPKQADPVPSTMNWDAFIGPAKYREYNEVYTPWNFRGWWDFGSGALGDMANHILQVAFAGLKLGAPKKVIGSSTMLMTDSCPSAEKITYIFPARENLPKLALPEVELTWYDGGLRPGRPEGLPDNIKLSDDGSCIFFGTKDTLVVSCYGNNPYLVSGRKPKVSHTIREVKDQNHQKDWIRACKESYENRVPSMGDFSVAGPMNETIVLGCAAVRLQALDQWLDWDAKNMRFTNIPADAKIRAVLEDKFNINDGHPTFDRTYSDPVSANEYAARLVKPVYREGWTLPEMPRL